jgi:hypothetical protein
MKRPVLTLFYDEDFPSPFHCDGTPKETIRNQLERRRI